MGTQCVAAVALNSCDSHSSVFADVFTKSAVMSRLCILVHFLKSAVGGSPYSVQASNSEMQKSALKAAAMDLQRPGLYSFSGAVRKHPEVSLPMEAPYGNVPVNQNVNPFQVTANEAQEES